MPFGRACGSPSVFSGVSKSRFLPERARQRSIYRGARPERDKFDRPHFSCAAASAEQQHWQKHSLCCCCFCCWWCGAAIFATYATSFLFVHSARRHRRRISLVYTSSNKNKFRKQGNKWNMTPLRELDLPVFVCTICAFRRIGAAVLVLFRVVRWNESAHQRFTMVKFDTSMKTKMFRL